MSKRRQVQWDITPPPRRRLTESQEELDRQAHEPPPCRRPTASKEETDSDELSPSQLGSIGECVPYPIFIVSDGGEGVTVVMIELEKTVRELKHKFAEQVGNLKLEGLELKFGGYKLDEHKRLSWAGVFKGATIYANTKKATI